MVLVRTSPRRFGVLCAALVSLSCTRKPQDGTLAATEPSGAAPASATASADVGPSPSGSSAAPASSASTAGSAITSGVAASALSYRPLPSTLDPACDDPRVVLAVRKQYDRSGRLWVQQSLVAHPEFVVVAERAAAPGEVDLYETIYGTKNFAPQKPGIPMFSEAVIARCKDAETCARLGGMFQAVSPADHPLLACKEPKATTGGFSRVKELAPNHLVAPDAKGPAAALCARAAACSAHLPGPSGDAPCKGVSAESLKKCAPLETCEKVVACFGGNR